MTQPNMLIEDELIAIRIGLEEAIPFLNDAAEQVNVWRRFAKTAYAAFQDVYACRMNADDRLRDDDKRIEAFKTEVDKCRTESKAMEAKQHRA